MTRQERIERIIPGKCDLRKELAGKEYPREKASNWYLNWVFGLLIVVTLYVTFCFGWVCSVTLCTH